MRLLWAYEHDFTAISPFLSQRIGTLCHHPCCSLWLEQRTTGWRAGRSEGDSKSLSAGTSPWTSYSSRRNSGSWVISLVRPTGRPAFHSVRHLRIGCRSQHRGMGLRPRRMKVRWSCPPLGVVATATPDPELTAMLARAAVSIGLDVNRPPSPEPWLIVPLELTALPCAENLFSRCGVKLGEYDGTPHGRAVLNYLSSFRGRNVLPLKPFQRLLGHMASVAAVTPLGLLHMRPLQHWLHSRIPRWAWCRGTLRVSITHHSATRNTFARFYSVRIEPVSSCVLGNR